MKSAWLGLFVVLGGVLTARGAHADPAQVQKTNPMKIFMHYMPWFETPATLGAGQWGFHWKFLNQNPNVVDSTGRRQIASHYYPKIGPYASSDPDVLEYHLLLMKLSGVDGVIIDWYGVQGTNGDIDSLLNNSNALIGKVDDLGLKFGVDLEDRFSSTIDNAKANVGYLRDHYFNNPDYIRQGPSNNPLLMVFGPITFTQPAQWTDILSQAGGDVDFLTLWNQSQQAGTNADGEYVWPYENTGQDNYLSLMSNYYQQKAPRLSKVAGVAYPGFNDFYQEGGLGNVVPFEIPHNSGQTLQGIFDLVSQHAADIDMLQLATWNDFGEGTMFEPTVETGFQYLHELQQFTGVAFTVDDLQQVYRLYRLRKKFAGDAVKQAQLNQASADMAALQLPAARSILDVLAPPGDFTGDGAVDGADFLKWQTQLGSAGLFPERILEADANGDGVVDAVDLSVWQVALAASLSAQTAAVQVSAPSSGALLLAACGVLAAAIGFR